MKLIDKLSDYERNLLLRWHVMPLLNKTMAQLIAAGHQDTAKVWEDYTNILITLVTTARQEMYDARGKEIQGRQD